jgi:hypothetical protein
MRDNGVQIESWGPFAECRNNLFSDHRDPAVVRRLGSFRIHD